MKENKHSVIQLLIISDQSERQILDIREAGIYQFPTFIFSETINEYTNRFSCGSRWINVRGNTGSVTNLLWCKTACHRREPASCVWQASVSTHSGTFSWPNLKNQLWFYVMNQLTGPFSQTTWGKWKWDLFNAYVWDFKLLHSNKTDGGRTNK